MESNQLSRFERAFKGYDGTFVGVMPGHSLVDFSEFQWPFFSL